MCLCGDVSAVATTNGSPWALTETMFLSVNVPTFSVSLEVLLLRPFLKQLRLMMMYTKYVNDYI